MAQGDFTKEEAARVGEVLDDLFKGIPKSKVVEYLGHLNDISLFIEAAKRAAPGATVEQPKTRKGSK